MRKRAFLNFVSEAMAFSFLSRTDLRPWAFTTLLNFHEDRGGFDSTP